MLDHSLHCRYRWPPAHIQLRRDLVSHSPYQISVSRADLSALSVTHYYCSSTDLEIYLNPMLIYLSSFFIIGAVLPIPFYYLSWKYPDSWYRYFNAPVFFTGTVSMMPFSLIWRSLICLATYAACHWSQLLIMGPRKSKHVHLKLSLNSPPMQVGFIFQVREKESLLRVPF